MIILCEFINLWCLCECFRLNLVRNSLVCSFKFIKENLGWTSLNLLNFISHFLSKKCFLSAWEILGFARFLAGFYYLALLCQSCKRYENFSLTMHLLQISLSSNKPRIDRTTRAIKQKRPQQKLSILLLKPRRSTICCRISSFDKISIKSSKKVICSPL